MPKHENASESEEVIKALLMPVSQHTSLLKKAGVKNIPEETLRLYREDLFPAELREFVRRLLVVTDYSNMKTIMPKHVTAVYKSITGKTLLYTPYSKSRKLKAVEDAQMPGD